MLSLEYQIKEVFSAKFIKYRNFGGIRIIKRNFQYNKQIIDSKGFKESDR